jgi:hypothetical protein
LLAAAPAHAAGPRFASPTGTAAQDCLTPATACNIEKAVNVAVGGDQVFLASGTYTTATPLINAGGISVRGTAGQRPVITTTATHGLFLFGPGVTVSDLEVVHSGTTVGLGVFSADSVTEHVVVRSSGSVACSLGIQGVGRDSLCVATGAGGVALDASFGGGGANFTGSVRNITAVATGPGGIGYRSMVNGAATTLTVDARNLIASGDTDVVREATVGATVNLALQGSNYQTVTQAGPGSLTAPGSGTNQTAEPVFADTMSYHQAPASPTVDAGTADPLLGSTDLDGEARVRGKGPDIGADEYPSDTTAPETTIGKKPKKKTYKKRASFTFTANEPGVSFLCKLDKKPAAPCTSPYKKKVRKPGKHTFSVQAVDTAGNLDATPATYKWKVRKRR